MQQENQNWMSGEVAGLRSLSWKVSQRILSTLTCPRAFCAYDWFKSLSTRQALTDSSFSPRSARIDKSWFTPSHWLTPSGS